MCCESDARKLHELEENTIVFMLKGVYGVANNSFKILTRTKFEKAIGKTQSKRLLDKKLYSFSFERTEGIDFIVTKEE